MRVLRLLVAARSALSSTISLMRDERVPLFLKAASVGIALVIISPVDIFGDIPVLGALDDAALLALLCMWFVRQAAKHVEPVPVRKRPGSALAVSGR